MMLYEAGCASLDSSQSVIASLPNATVSPEGVDGSGLPRGDGNGLSIGETGRAFSRGEKIGGAVCVCLVIMIACGRLGFVASGISGAESVCTPLPIISLPTSREGNLRRAGLVCVALPS